MAKKRPVTSKRRATAQQAEQIADWLAVEYADAVCALEHQSAWQLLIATILSAQCTDERVNLVTPALFARFPSPAKLALAQLVELEELIKSTGFFRNKAKNILGCCQAMVRDHQGEVPQALDALTKLPGVGRKTANVVLGTAFGIPSGVVVDTHVGRITKRLGLTTGNSAEKIEQDLIRLLPPKQWIDFSHRLIWHGRQVCKALKPRCADCGLSALCPQVGVPAAPAKEKRSAKRLPAAASKATRKSGGSSKTAPAALPRKTPRKRRRPS